jgi:hypothetical protein
MLQNIDLLPSITWLQKMKQLGKVTCTTAHERYSTQEMRRELGFPLHKLSWFLSPEKYIKKAYSEKENLMIVSHDDHPRKSLVLNMITKKMPNMRIQIIQNLTYNAYKQLISQAKWALTFGEGLDGYFVEAVFSGGISFSVYNQRFFTEDFKSLRTIYENYDALAARICSDIEDLDDEMDYTNYQLKEYNLCRKYFNHEEYVRNIKLFYEKKYTYP